MKHLLTALLVVIGTHSCLTQGHAETSKRLTSRTEINLDLRDGNKIKVIISAHTLQEAADIQAAVQSILLQGRPAPVAAK